MSIFTGNMELLLKQILSQQLTHEKNGDYMQAEECRLNYEKQSDSYQNKRIQEMNLKHKQEEEDLEKAKMSELNTFNSMFEKDMTDFSSQSNKTKEELSKKHEDQIKKTKQSLTMTLPTKVKESPELLNLRKMEEHMAKQKNYVEAHQTQEKIGAYLKKESETWEINRQTKIETALNTLKSKQKVEMTNLEKRIATSKDEKQLERKVQEKKIMLKYENFMKDLKNANEKEILAFKGELTSIGGTGTASSSPVKSRSSFSGSASKIE